MSILPYEDQQKSKKEQVAEMFDNISPKYDFLNHFLSLGIDKGWRRKAVKMLAQDKPKTVLDVATGTGDFAFEVMRAEPEKVIGVDISEGMLSFGRKKVKKKGLEGQVELKYGDSENLPFDENNFDAAIVAFGVRNFENLELGLQEIFRVLKPGGRLLVLEFSQPQAFPFKQVYNLYFKHILPGVGKMVSRDKRAYTYLPQSVEAFPYGDKFVSILEKIGFTKTACKPLTFGISSIYSGYKP